MVAYYGMSEQLPHIKYYDMQSDGYGLTKPYSDKTAELIDKEATEIVRIQYERAKELLKEHADGLKELAQLLLDREVIYTEDVEHIFGKRQWLSRTDEIIKANEVLAVTPHEEASTEAHQPASTDTPHEESTDTSNEHSAHE